jgi:hypothetical protein
VPAVIVVPPLKVFAPVNVNVPLPLFTKLPPPLITPLYTVLAEPFNVRTFACNFTAPAPANVAISSLLANFNVPSAFTVTAIVFANALPPLNVNIPASTTVTPLNVFAPDNVNSPPPTFVKALAPLTTPLNVTPLATSNVVAPLNVASPESVKAPVFVASPKPSDPLKVSAFATVRAVTLSLAIFPPLNTNVPVPNAALSPTNTVPAPTAAPPLNAFVPDNVNSPVPFFTKLPLPLITPP